MEVPSGSRTTIAALIGVIACALSFSLRTVKSNAPPDPNGWDAAAVDAPPRVFTDEQLSVALREKGISVGQAIPDIIVYDAKGQPFKLTGRKRRTVLVFGCLT